MKKVPLFAAAVVLIAGSALTAETQAHEGLGCFENLQAPDYPTAALQDHVDGSVWTYTHANPQGVPEKIDTQVASAWSQANKLLVPPWRRLCGPRKLNRSVRARLSPLCSGTRFTVKPCRILR